MPATSEPLAVRDTRPGSIYDVARALPGMRLEMWQIGPENRRWSLLEVRLHDTVLLSGVMASPHAVAGAVDKLSVFVKLRGPGRRTINGCPLASDDLAVVGGGADLRAVTSGPIDWFAVQVAPDELQAYGELKGGTGLRFARGEMRSVRADRDALLALRDAVTTLLRHAKRRDGLSTRVPIRPARAHVLFAVARCLQSPGEPLRSGYDTIVRRAMAYLRDHERDVIYVADLCLSTQTSERWLREAFHRVYGTSPAHFLRLRRLNQARQSLLSGRPSASVTETASALGFFDFGRFAMAYRGVFGESPSTTLRRATAL
jgi:AraC family ethanolamine operon transcriptional activator